MQYLKITNFPGNGHLENWWRFFVKFAEDEIYKIALDELMEIVTFCISKVPDVNRIVIGKTIPTVKEFAEVRTIDVGVSHQFYFIQIDAGVKLTDDLKNDPNWTGLQKQGTIHMAGAC